MAELYDTRHRISNDTRYLEVQRVPCATCIYRADSPLDLAALEAAVTDPTRPGHFTGHRACHHASARKVCCRGFWNRHKDAFLLGQLAQRFGRVVFVIVDDGGLDAIERLFEQLKRRATN